MEEELNIIHIHAGITTRDIVNKILEINSRAEQLTSQSTKENQHIWVFFDEFNTTNALPNICEILVER